MNPAQTWWAAPAAALVGVLTTLVWTGRSERSRRRDEANMSVYLGFWNSCLDLLGLTVWSADRSEEPPPAPARPLLDQIGRLGREVGFRGSARVIACAHRAEQEAITFATLVEDLRRTTMRGTGGELDDQADSRYRPAHARFAAAIEAFGVASRRDVKLRGRWGYPR